MHILPLVPKKHRMRSADTLGFPDTVGSEFFWCGGICLLINYVSINRLLFGRLGSDAPRALQKPSAGFVQQGSALQSCPLDNRLACSRRSGLNRELQDIQISQ